MKLFFLILLNIFFVINSFTQDIKEVITTTHSKKIEKSFDLGNGKKFSNLYFEGTWTNNLGNYGRNECIGTVSHLTNNIDLNIMCESIDKNNNKEWSLLTREGEMISGIGISTVVETTASYKKNYVGTKCTYATTYLDDVNFTISKCPVSKNLYDIMLKEVN